jgi:hypothetical protein
MNQKLYAQISTARISRFSGHALLLGRAVRAGPVHAGGLRHAHGFFHGISSR